MAKYVYPAIFEEDEKGQYTVIFPDIQGCYTFGENLAEAMEMANDALCLMLYGKEERGEAIPPASSIRDIAASTNEIVSLVECDTLVYWKMYEKKTVKKTVTIPGWLNTLAERAGINFSLALQNALRSALKLD